MNVLSIRINCTIKKYDLTPFTPLNLLIRSICGSIRKKASTVAQNTRSVRLKSGCGRPGYFDFFQPG